MKIVRNCCIRRINKSIFKIIILWAILSQLILSCTTSKNMVYLRNVKVTDTITSKHAINTVYKIQASDILSIRVISLNNEVSKIFNNVDMSSNNSYVSQTNLTLLGYVVNDSGYIEMPVIGKIKVEGLTLDNTKEFIQQKINEYVKDATVYLRLLTFRITILGEVRSPGTVNTMNNKVTIFEALSLAGDVNDYGCKRNVLVIRKIDGQEKIYSLDLTKGEDASIRNFEILPNDVIYVQPIKAKVFRSNAPTLSIIISLINTSLILFNFYTKIK